MKLSIIVPVYNTEEYLKECLDSVTPQLTDDMEVILVNDGSTDGSQKICEEYQEKYSQVRLINQQNQGLSAARNTGIHEAVGDYLLFIDSDDFIATSVLRDLIQFANNQDVIFLDAVKYYREDWQEPLAEGYQQKFICQKSPKQVLEFLANLPKFIQKMLIGHYQFLSLELVIPIIVTKFIITIDKVVKHLLRVILA